MVWFSIHKRFQNLAAGALVASCVLGTAPAFAAGDVAHGEELAIKWCKTCHVIDASMEDQEGEIAPRFDTMIDLSDAILRTFVQAPHPFMPEFDNLTDQDIEDLIAYIRTQKR